MRYWFTDPDANLSTIAALPTLADKLKSVKDAMQVDVSAVDFDDVRSIPDAWYIHRIYEMMMLHPITGEVYKKYQAAVLRHWHAICAVYFIGVQKFDLKMESSTLESAVFDAMPAGTDAQIQTKSIMQSTWKARPTRRISEHPFFDPNSIKIHYVVDPKTGTRLPFAMSSATAFLVPTADAWKNLYTVCPDIPWIQAVRDAEGHITKYRVVDPAYHAGMLTLSERRSFRNSLDQIAQAAVNNSVPEEQNATFTFSNLITAYINDSAGLLAPPSTPDIFPDDLKLHYVAIPGNSAAPSAADEQIGGVDARCTCSITDRDGTYINYLVSLPISEQAKGWLLDGTGKYEISVTMAAGSPQFTAVFTYGGVVHRKTFCQAAANIAEISAINMGITAMWPRYKMDNWTRYFVFRKEATGAHTGAGDTYAIVPEGDPLEKEIYKRDDLSEDNLIETAIVYAEFNRWPQSWVLEKKDNAGNTERAGYFLTREIPAPVQVPGRRFTAAIDFGTSSTMIYGRHNNVAAALDGANLWSLPLFAGTSRSSEIYRFFIPSTHTPNTIMPLQTILAIENTNKASILLGNWHYFRQSAETLSRRVLPKRFDVHSNLKWSPITGALYTASFLEIISHMIVLEARSRGCTEVDTIITYPSAMTSWNSFLEKMETQLKSACKNAALTYGNDSSVTESEAVARRMSEIVPEATQFCSIDIGGGTSDIFLFKNDGNVTRLEWDGYESSLLCGARDILLEGFVRDQECLFDLIGLDASDPIMKEMLAQVPQIDSWHTELEREEVQRNIEFLLAANFTDSTRNKHNAGEELRLRAVSEAGLLRPSIAKLRKRIAFRLAAILYYAGLMTQGTGTRINELHLQFAGNGSKALLWIADDVTKVKAFLSAMFNAGAGLDPKAPDYAARAQNPTNIAFSQNHKHEVADGAMRNPILMGLHVDEILAGERVELYNAAGEVFDEWPMNQNIAEELFQNASNFVPSNEMLKAFVASFRASTMAILAIPLRQDEFDPAIADASGIRLRINNTIADIVNHRTLDKKSFFMIGVDALCEQYFI